MKYHVITLEVPINDLATAESICQMAVPYGFQTEDYSDIEELMRVMPRELIDEDLLAEDRTQAKIHLYISEEVSPMEAASFLEERMKSLGIPYVLSFTMVDEEEYSNAWKKYFKPLRVGKNMMVVPTWEEYAPKSTDVIIDLEPGMAFGTGTHETTRLCMEFLEEWVEPDSRVLDVGCGSGILAIMAIKLGAKEAIGTDLDPVAVRVAQENAHLNHVDIQTEFLESDLASGVEGKFSIICANIVADAVIRLCPSIPSFLAQDGIFISSGIIDIRSDEVVKALEENGFQVIAKKEEAGWVAFAAKLRED